MKNHSIQVPLPYGVNPTIEDLELLQVAFATLVDLRFPGSRNWEQVEDMLTADGWTLSARLAWVVDARRGHEAEQAVGRTKDEAYEQLQQRVRIDEVASVV